MVLIQPLAGMLLRFHVVFEITFNRLTMCQTHFTQELLLKMQITGTSRRCVIHTVLLIVHCTIFWKQIASSVNPQKHYSNWAWLDCNNNVQMYRLASVCINLLHCESGSEPLGHKNRKWNCCTYLEGRGCRTARELQQPSHLLGTRTGPPQQSLVFIVEQMKQQKAGGSMKH